jgi:hypothetical protein
MQQNIFNSIESKGFFFVVVFQSSLRTFFSPAFIVRRWFPIGHAVIGIP